MYVGYQAPESIADNQVASTLGYQVLSGTQIAECGAPDFDTVILPYSAAFELLDSNDSY